MEKTLYSIQPLPKAFARKRMVWRTFWGVTAFLLLIATWLLDGIDVAFRIVLMLFAFVCFGIGFVWSFKSLRVNGKVLKMEQVDDYVPHHVDVFGFVDHDKKIVYISRFF